MRFQIRRPFWLDFVANLGSFGGGLLLSFLTRILVAQAVGPSGKGVWVLVFLAYRQGMEFFSLGIHSALFYHVGRSLIGKREACLISMLFAFLLGLPSGLFVLGILNAVLKTSSFSKIFTIFAILTPFSLYTFYLEMIANVEGRIVETSLLRLAGRFLHALAVALCLLFSPAIDSILIAGAGAEALYILISWALFFRWNLFPPPILRPRWEWGRMLALYGLKGHLGTIFQSLNYRLDVYILALFFSPREVGLYSVAVGFSELLWIVPNALGMVIGQRAAVRSWGEANRITSTVTRLMLFALLWGCLLWPFLGRLVIPLFFGKAFREAVGPVAWLMPGIWLLSLWKNLVNDISSRGFPLIKTYTSGVALAATVILDLLLIPKYGIKGAGAASSIAYGVAAFLALLLYSKVTGVKVWEPVVVRCKDFKALLVINGGKGDEEGQGKRKNARNGEESHSKLSLYNSRGDKEDMGNSANF